MSDKEGSPEPDLLNVRIPTQTKKSQKRKHIRTEFDDTTLDASAIAAQRKEKERLERLEKLKTQNGTDHLTDYERLLMNSTQNAPLPQLDIEMSDFYEPSDYYKAVINGDPYFGPMPTDSSYNRSQPSTSNGTRFDVIDVSSDSETDEVQLLDYKPTSYRINRPSPKKPRYLSATKDRDDYEQMEEQYSKEEQRIKRMRDLKELESTEKCGGRLLVNAGHPEEDPDVFVIPHLTHVLQPHQLGGIRFMYDNTIESMADYKSSPGVGCILAHSMGLGKTIQIITFSEIFFRATKAKKIMIIVPINTIQNWYAEYDKWIPKFSDTGEVLRTFDVFLLGDNQKTFDQRVNCIEEWDQKGGCLLIGYDMFRLLIKSTKPKTEKKKRPKLNLNGASSGYVDEQAESVKSFDIEPDVFYTAGGRIKTEAHDLLIRALLDPGPDLVVCDEGHKIKNLNTDISISLGSIKTTRRIVLTGYPLQNNLMEYYCMIDFVRPKYLGTKKSFIERFEKPIKNGQCSDSTENDMKLARQRTHVLVELVKGFVQRRTHHLLKSILPESREYVILLRKSNVQRLLYRNFVLYAKNEIQTKNTNTFNPLKAFAACSKIWNHPDVLANLMEKLGMEDMGIERNAQNQVAGSNIQENMNIGGMTLRNQPIMYNMNMPMTHFNGSYQPISSGNGSINGMESPANGKESVYASLQYVNGSPVKATKKKGRPPKKSLVSSSPFPNSNGYDIDETDGTIKYDWSKEILTRYVKGNIENGYKMVVTMEILNECTKLGEKILIFSQNLTALSLMEEYLSQRRVELKDGPGERWEKNRNYLRFDGSTTGVDREKFINRFNSEKTLHLFLISTRAGSLGINLVSANRCIIFDACWNPCHDAQAVCRVYRYGQQRRTYIYRLIMDNSMEKAIFNRQISKHGMQQRVVDEAQVDANITQKELETLLVYDEALDVVHDKWDTSDWEMDDSLLQNLTEKFSHLLSQKPFLHESLILESDRVLSEEEKKEAKLLFEREKRGEIYGMGSMVDEDTNPYQLPHQFMQYMRDNHNTYDHKPIIHGPGPLRPSPMPHTLQMNTPNYGGMGGATMASSSNAQYNFPDHPYNNRLTNNDYSHVYEQIQARAKAYANGESVRFPGALYSYRPSFNPVGFIQNIVTDNEMTLPVIGQRNSAYTIPRGTQAQLVCPKTGLYLKLRNDYILDASTSILSRHARQVMEYMHPLAMRLPNPGQNDIQKFEFGTDVIELD